MRISLGGLLFWTLLAIGLAAPGRITRIGLLTRTMGSSAQIESFQTVTDLGETP